MSPLLSIRQLGIAFEGEDGMAPGVQGIDLEVRRGEIVALVGESGSGKSITALSILQLLPTPPTRYLSGEILFTDKNDTDRNDADRNDTSRSVTESNGNSNGNTFGNSNDQCLDLLKQSPAQMQKIRGNG